MLRLLSSIVLLALLGGCVSREGSFVHPDGRTAQCSATGFGLITGLIALDQYGECRAGYLRAGYVGG